MATSSRFRIAQFHVLVLDDDEGVVRAVARVLGRIGFTVHTCGSIAEADQLLEDRTPHIAIVDHHLGSTDTGLDYLSRLGTRFPSCFRILFTGETDVDFIVHSINKRYIDAFLPKPWNDEGLIALVHQGQETAQLRLSNESLNQQLVKRNAQLEDFNKALEDQVLERTRSLREANQQLRTYQSELVRLETQATLTQLIRGLAHEINNPLSVILGHTERLERILDGDQQTAGRLGTIRGEIDRCINLVEQLRSFSMPLHEPIRATAIEDVVGRAAMRIEQRKMNTPLIKFTDGMPNVLAAQDAMTRVLEQVLENAIQAGANHVWISASVEYDRVLLELANDGETPDDDTIHHAVRPFFTTRSDGSPGLGLSLAASLLREQGGTISFDRRDGEAGAKIMISLPVAGTSAIRRANVGGEEKPPVLIIENDPLIATLLMDAIEDTEHQTVVVTDVEHARTWLTDHEPSCVFCDTRMDRVMLEQFVTSTLASHEQLGDRIVLVGNEREAVHFDHLGDEASCRYLRKPFRVEEVQELVRVLAG